MPKGPAKRHKPNVALNSQSPSRAPLNNAGYCAPNRINMYNKNRTCLTLHELQVVANEYNKNHMENPIPESAFQSAFRLRTELEERFKQCDNDACWIEQDVVKDVKGVLSGNYRPPMPAEWTSNDRTWLNTFDILKVMKQYEDDTFVFLGVFPLDFYQKKNNVCISRNMCDFKIDGYIDKGKTQFAAIVNLDKHDQSGSHWVSFFCNADPKSPKYGLCYYDSVGHKPPLPIYNFLKDVRLQIINYWDSRKITTLPFSGKYNYNKHQVKNTECGIFSMLFCILCTEFPNETYKETRDRVPTHRNDDMVHSLRYILYRPPTYGKKQNYA